MSLPAVYRVRKVCLHSKALLEPSFSANNMAVLLDARLSSRFGGQNSPPIIHSRILTGIFAIPLPSVYMYSSFGAGFVPTLATRFFTIVLRIEYQVCGFVSYERNPWYCGVLIVILKNTVQLRVGCSTKHGRREKNQECFIGEHFSFLVQSAGNGMPKDILLQSRNTKHKGNGGIFILSLEAYHSWWRIISFFNRY